VERLVDQRHVLAPCPLDTAATTGHGRQPAAQPPARDDPALFTSGRLQPGDEDRYGAINGRFHDLIVQSGGSALLQSLIERVNRAPFVSPETIVFDSEGQTRAYILLLRAHGQHHAIVDAIRTRDGARAEMLFREHAHGQRLSMFTKLGGKPA
jgi:GntR family transcriptional regulator of vanillate catabolism